MKELRTEIIVDADAATVWSVLLDFASYPEWNPMLTSVEGKVVEGSRLKIVAELNPLRRMGFKPLIVKLATNEELRWRGRLILPGLFEGEHSFVLEGLDNSRTRFIQQEQFSGILVPLIFHFIGEETERGFHAMNKALKTRAERLNSDSGRS